MNRLRFYLLLSCLAATFLLALAPSASAQLRVGAGKADITPDADKVPEPLQAIHDHIFTRAIIVENGGRLALLMNVELGGLPVGFYEKLATEITTRYGIPRENMIISAAHIHSSGSILDPAQAPGPNTTSNKKAFTDKTYKAMLDAVKQAHDSLQPAEMGFGEGKLYLNVNRDAIDPKTRLWAQEPDVNAPSDKTLAVLEFRKPGGGDPIAVYMNYPMHAVTMFLTELISGDYPEVAQSYLEDVYDNKVVAVFTEAPEGDQNPLYMRAILAINEPRIHAEMDPAKPNDMGEYNDAIMHLFQGGAKRPLAPMDPKVFKQAWRVVEAQGTLMAEEALRVMNEIPTFSNSAIIQGATADISCPGRKRVNHEREGFAGVYEDGPPVAITIGALRLGDVAIGRINGEPYNRIGQEAKQGSPFRNTMIVAIVSGGSSGGYMPTDDAYGHYTFQAVGTRVKPGCAEMGIVNGIDNLLRQDLQSSTKQ